jgi:hypothetical protein
MEIVILFLTELYTRIQFIQFKMILNYIFSFVFSALADQSQWDVRWAWSLTDARALRPLCTRIQSLALCKILKSGTSISCGLDRNKIESRPGWSVFILQYTQSRYYPLHCINIEQFTSVKLNLYYCHGARGKHKKFIWERQENREARFKGHELGEY